MIYNNTCIFLIEAQNRNRVLVFFLFDTRQIFTSASCSSQYYTQYTLFSNVQFSFDNCCENFTSLNNLCTILTVK